MYLFVKLVTMEIYLFAFASSTAQGEFASSSHPPQSTMFELNTTVPVAVSPSPRPVVVAEADCQMGEDILNDQFLVATMNEFVYGQMALWGEKCNRSLWETEVWEKIWNVGRKAGLYSAAMNLWVHGQKQYLKDMAANKTNSFRARTCQSHHMMECSEEKNSKGDNYCQCLCRFPDYNLIFDEATKECRAKIGARCYDLLDLFCVTGATCVQAYQENFNTGQCLCVVDEEAHKYSKCTGCPYDAPTKTDIKVLPMKPEDCPSKTSYNEERDKEKALQLLVATKEVGGKI